MDTSGHVTGGTAPPLDAAATAHHRFGWIRAAPLAMWAALAAAAGYVLANNPTDRDLDPLGGCGWYAAFGTNGPTCGGTRMVWYLLHGDIVNAARSHLVALAGVPLAVYALVQWTAASLFRWRLPALRLPGWAWIAYGVLFVVYGAVLRNLPGFEWFHLDYMQPGTGL
ncbi:MAG TPA: DUF2752 domain-containing protein [Jiangellales bacterium]|nr:DUF2752 domain-containing protein [Jiangellales bacterium]